jgi:RecA/RadA recombinase
MHPGGDIEVLAEGAAVHIPASGDEEKEPEPKRENPKGPWVAHVVQGDDELATIELPEGEEERLIDEALERHTDADAVEIESGAQRVEIDELRGVMRAAHRHQIPVDIRLED